MPGGSKFRLRGPLAVFLLCLVIAGSLWLVIRLSDSYSSGVYLKLRYVNVPNGKVLVPPVDSVITIRFQAQGFKILSLEWFKKPKPFYIDVSKQKFENENGRSVAKLNFNKLAQLISEMNDIKDEFTGFEPENVVLILESTESKKVVVIPDLDISFEKDFKLSGPVIIDPDSIMISGTTCQVRDVNAVKTELVKIKKLNQNTVVETSIQPPKNGKVGISPEKVKIIVNVKGIK